MYKYFSKNLNFINIKSKLFYSTKDNKENHNQIKNIKLDNLRHFPPAIREWNNSVYNFNKNNSSYSVVKYNQLDLLFKNYFNLSNKVKIARSKRMRYLRRKSTSVKVYLSKPEIKQTNDKIRITVYYFDRYKQLLVKRLFFYNKPKLIQEIGDLSQNKFLSKKLGVKQKKKFLIPYSGVRYLKELKDFSNKNILRNKQLEQSVYFQFIKYILSNFGIQIFVPLFLPFSFRKKDKIYNYSKRNLKKENQKMLINILKLNPNTLYWINLNTGVIDKIENENINYNFLIKKLAEQRKTFNKNVFNLKASNEFKLEIRNKLWSIINKLIIFNKITDVTIQKIFNNLSYKLSYISRHSLYKMRIRKIPKLLNFFQGNLLKYKKLLPSLKKLIDKLYNKKAELNLVDLKYFYLNSDILTQILISKIQKRINGMKVLKKSLDNIKPTTSLLIKRKANIFNNLGFLSLNNNLSLKSLPTDININNINNGKHYKNDILNNTFNDIFPNNYIYSDNINYKLKNSLNGIKYKSLLGVWIEARGRLTRRNTASRSITYRVYKGDLKDKDKYIYLNKENNVSTIMLRNNLRSNTQYTYKGSFRRIGSFGIRTWISSK